MKIVFFLLIGINILYAGSLNSLNSGKEDEKRVFGIEVNPFYLLVLTPGENSETTLSGTISYFDHKNSAEIAMPLSYISFDDSDYRQFTIDLHYRKFVDKRVGGFYVSGFARYANLDGYAGYLNGSARTKQSKIGFGAGIGYRYISHYGFYWGISLCTGYYLGKDNDLSYNTPMFAITDDRRHIVDIEFFKFGYTF